MNSFSEKQRFTQWWLWAIIITAALLPAVIIFVQWLRGAGNIRELVGGIMSTAIISALLALLFRAICLKTTIDDTGVSYQFYPLHLKPIKKNWDELDKVYVRQYSPLGEFGGWGIRYSLRKDKGMAYNIAGDMGLQLVFKSGRKILLGTQHPAAVKDVLADLKRAGKISADIEGVK